MIRKTERRIAKLRDDAARFLSLATKIEVCDHGETEIKLNHVFHPVRVLVCQHCGAELDCTWKSNAEWPKETGLSVTSDFHMTWEQAKAVCNILGWEGLGGGKEVFPVKVWVTGEKI